MSQQTSQAAEAARPVAVPLAVPSAAPASTLHLVSGRTMRRALLEARSVLGSKALVVDQRTDMDPATGTAAVTLAVSTQIPRSAEALRSLRAEAQTLLHDAASHAPKAPAPSAPNQRTPLADVERRLREHGASKKLRERVLEAVVAREDEEGAHPLDLAAVQVGGAFDVASLPLAKGRTTVLAFLGATGVGKTTSLAKLGARLSRAGRRVAIATLDVERPGALAEVRGIGESIGVPVAALQDPARFGRALSGAQGARYDVVLVDGSGDIPGDVQALELFRAQLDLGRVSLESLAVLPSGAGPAALGAVTTGLDPLGPIGVVVTKIDETSEALPVMEHAHARGLAIAFFSASPDIATEFHRASAERFADVALTGRIA